MGRKEAPSNKGRVKVLTLLEQGSISTTGGFGRLYGKIAAMAHLSMSEVTGVLNGTDGVILKKSPDGKFLAMLATRDS
jgi:uncharacterized protein with WD repeat